MSVPVIRDCSFASSSNKIVCWECSSIFLYSPNFKLYIPHSIILDSTYQVHFFPSFPISSLSRDDHNIKESFPWLIILRVAVSNWFDQIRSDQVIFDPFKYIVLRNFVPMFHFQAMAFDWVGFRSLTTLIETLIKCSSNNSPCC